MTRVTPVNGIIDLGRAGEHLAREVVIPLNGIAIGTGQALLLHQRSGDHDPYPVESTTRGMNLIWSVTNADTGACGYGQAEVRWLGEDGSIIKSQVYRTITQDSMQEPGKPPEGHEGYVNAVARDAQAARDAAAESRALYQKVQDDLAAGKLPGPPGEPGNDGANGDVGLSAYQIAVANGYVGSEADWLASLRGIDGTDGKDGRDGADGHTPEYGVDYGTPEQIAGIAQSAADILRPDVNQIKGDLANKEPLHKVLSATLVTGETTLTFTDAAITDNALIYIYTSVWGVQPSAVERSGDTLTLTFDAQSADLVVKVEVR